MSKPHKFKFDGQDYTALGETVDTEYGPENRVTIYNSKGKVVGVEQECGSTDTICHFWMQYQMEQRQPKIVQFGPTVRDVEIGLLLYRLHKNQEDMYTAMGDPMTTWAGIGGELSGDYRKQRRMILCEILERARKVKEIEAERFALQALEEWIP